jgi:heme A synthase
LFVQLALGAAFRHNTLSILPHLLGAVLVCCMAGLVVLRAMTDLPEQRPLQGLAILLGVLLIVQVALGGVSYFTRLPQSAAPGLDPVMIWTTTAHVGVGALLLGTSWALTLYSFRLLSRSRVAEAVPASPQKSLA